MGLDQVCEQKRSPVSRIEGSSFCFVVVAVADLQGVQQYMFPRLSMKEEAPQLFR